MKKPFPLSDAWLSKTPNTGSYLVKQDGIEHRLRTLSPLFELSMWCWRLLRTLVPMAALRDLRRQSYHEVLSFGSGSDNSTAAMVPNVFVEADMNNCRYLRLKHGQVEAQVKASDRTNDSHVIEATLDDASSLAPTGVDTIEETQSWISNKASNGMAKRARQGRNPNNSRSLRKSASLLILKTLLLRSPSPQRIASLRSGYCLGTFAMI
jgi:hypothetical protein